MEKLTSDMVLSAIEHISCVDKLVPCTTNPQLRLCVAKNDFTSETQKRSLIFRKNIYIIYYHI